MSSFDKAVTRKTVGRYNVLRSGSRRAREVVVRLMFRAGEDLIEFRELRTRQRWVLGVETAFKHAVRLAAFQASAEKRRKAA